MTYLSSHLRPYRYKGRRRAHQSTTERAVLLILGGFWALAGTVGLIASVSAW